MNCTTPTRLPRPSMRKRQAERRGRFALAGAGVDDEQALLDLLVRDLGVLHGLALRHLGAVALGFGLVDGLAHGCPFTISGSPATSRTTRSARAGDPLIEPALQIAKAPRLRIVRHDTGADFVGRPARRGRMARASAASRRSISASMSRFVEHAGWSATASGNRPARPRRPARQRLRRRDRAAPRWSAIARRGGCGARRCAPSSRRRTAPRSRHRSKAAAMP